jgi:Uma2 family endonuclease
MNQIDRHARFEPAADAPLEAVQDAFLRWAEGRLGRHELVGGKITARVGASEGHAELMALILAQFLAQVDRKRFLVTGAELGVRTPAGVRYPDILVSQRTHERRALSATGPVFIAEILSPSSVAIDMIEKAAEYTAMPSVEIYAVFSQDEARAWIWERRDGHFPEAPVMIAGRDAALPLEPIGATLRFDDLYAALEG